LKSTDVSEERAAYSFTIEEEAKQETSRAEVDTCFMLVSCFCSETSLDVQRTTQHYIPEGRTLHNHRYENLKSCTYYHFIALQSHYLSKSMKYSQYFG
jgi:hypothetical protein